MLKLKEGDPAPGFSAVDQYGKGDHRKDLHQG